MTPSLRSEFRKLFTIRSTYIISGFALLLAGFISFWALGYKGEPGDHHLFMDAAKTTVQAISLFTTIIAVLLVTHEYRYNTIMYTLTASNSRSKALLSKMAVVTTYVLAFTAFAVLFAVAMAWLGTTIKGNELVTQQFFFSEIIWRLTFYMWAYAMTGLLLGVLFRHVVGALVTLLLAPITIEPLLGLVLKENTKYLPFSAIEQVIGNPMMLSSSLAYNKAAMLFGVYLAAGWLIAWFLFSRRDAN